MRLVAKGFAVLGIVAVVLVCFAWLLLSSALFSSMRTAFIENLIAKNLGQPVLIEDGVQIGIGKNLAVSAGSLRLPSAAVDGVDLAVINTLDFDVSVKNLWNGRLSLSGFTVSGVHLNLLTDENGTSTWQGMPPQTGGPSNPSKTPEAMTRKILSDQKIDVADVTVLYQNAINGLDLDLKLSELTGNSGNASQDASFFGAGSLNGEPYEVQGRFPSDAPFQVLVEFEHFSIAANQVAEVSEMEVKTAIEIGELGQLQNVLKLNRVLEGTGSISATYRIKDDVARIDDVDVGVQLAGGQSLAVTGHIGELGNPADVSLATRIRLYPEDAEPAPTEKRKDLKLIAVDMVIDSVPGETPQRQMVIKTNGFTLDTSGEGPPPIAFSGISRTPNGALRVGNVNLRIGVPSNPIIILNGSVEDALQVQGISAEGVLDIPASSLISPELLGPDDQLGKFSGVFHINGDLNQLSLTDLDGETSETDIWSLDVHGTVSNVLKFEDIDLGIEVNVPSGAELLQALSLEPVQTGPASFAVNLRSQGADWNADADVSVADSALKFSADLDDATTNPVLLGSIESDLIKIEQIRTIILAAMQLRNLGNSDTGDTAPEEVVNAQNDETSGPLRDVSLKPIGRSVLLSGLNMDIGVDLRKIEGAKGISSLQSELTLDESDLRVGPLEFEYGGGHFHVNGHMDLNDDAHRLALSGKAGGWQLDDILHSLNFQKGASGTIHADFDLTGGTETVKDFVRSMAGDVTVSLYDGSIETQLLDLAGLGLLPWVFSKEKQKVAPIVCLRAPFSVSNGSISTKTTTLETDQVQVVVFGQVNLTSKELDLSLQPRKIGDPLSRSPWPATIKGPLADPKIKVKDGPKRLKRSDGADQMPAERQLCVPDILQLQ
ncbi:AsmA family protein [Shimia abyssi]|uniref:AsmA-like protein n=1 Tax=Shimia abyssi TaxID=1662395 RepID=A0A2P8FCG8_9RHOB|nr:AsmA family protein [Shimia abyssi]PSL19404.1 AsmA-like protein [Shimia abyssi]